MEYKYLSSVETAKLAEGNKIISKQDFSTETDLMTIILNDK